ncbi:hypothetical protein [Actinomadura decatromicini]|uniref:Uncharacterized protein n=1 Tax=Actinomadura decatromicini TaxID=2604572 RepID=A0A5D3FUR5_9ACTN|nr:hypothetical protein [Actinomadura decatromicini]TYK52607.1 hypothetical protein FXF68_02215 [Actinomadura decatromicini]
MRGPRRAREAERQIAGFAVYELPDGSWRAVSQQDGARVEHERWCELAWTCVSSRIADELRVAGEELAARMAEPGRAWRTESQPLEDVAPKPRH